MSRGLLRLPLELIVGIADLLLKDETNGNPNDDEESIGDDVEDQTQNNRSMDGDEEDENSDEKESMADTSDKQIADDQESPQRDDKQANDHTPSGQQAIYNLSRTCTSMYEILSPYLFRFITLRNTEKSGQAVQYLCRTNRVANVKTLHFQAEAPGDNEENFHDVDGVFPPKVNEILSNLSQFPHLETLVIDFDFHLNEEDPPYRWGDVLSDLLADDAVGAVENKEEMKKAEEQEGWRALVKRTLEAVSRNKSSHVRELVYKDYPIIVNSVFGSENFNKWLEELDSFRFEVYGGDNGAGWKANTGLRSQNYINNLDHHFLSALQNVTRLAIIGHEQGAIGQTMFHEAVIPFRKERVPKLKELELGYYFIQDDLLDFLIAHSSTLERLVFNHCFLEATNEWYGLEDFEEPGNLDEPENERQETWNSWFQRYASKAPQALQRLSFKPYNATIGRDSGSASPKLVKKIMQAFAEQRAQGNEIRVFPYGEIDDKYGMLFEKEDCNGYKAWRGWDMEGWNELRVVMQRNRKRIGRE